MEGKPEDVRPAYANGTHISYSKHTMKYKRYKTLSSKYLQGYPRLDASIRYILYLDIDNVVTNPLQTFFQDYQNKVNHDYARTGVTDLSGHSLISFWMDPSTTNMIQGDQFLLERFNGQSCLDAWRYEMDHQVASDRNQPLLMDVARQFDKYHCLVSLLPNGSPAEQQSQHFDLLHPDILGATQAEEYPTIVHISGHRARLFSERQQRDFLKRALNLDQTSENTLINGLTVDDLLQPIGVKGQRPK